MANAWLSKRCPMSSKTWSPARGFSVSWRCFVSSSTTTWASSFVLISQRSLTLRPHGAISSGCPCAAGAWKPVWCECWCQCPRSLASKLTSCALSLFLHRCCQLWIFCNLHTSTTLRKCILNRKKMLLYELLSNEAILTSEKVRSWSESFWLVL